MKRSRMWRPAAALLAACVAAGCQTDGQSVKADAALQSSVETEAEAMEARIERDMSLLTSAAPEPPGPGTPLGPHAEVHIAPANGLDTHTVFYPADIAGWGEGEKLPVLVWGNGACRNEGRRFERTLTKVASHGFLVVAVGRYDYDPEAPSTTGAQMIEAIDWLGTAAASSGELAGHIDTDNIAVMGQSCGGLMTIEAAHDPRIDTIGVINSGVFEGPGGLSLTTATKETLKTFHTPALYIDGGARDAAHPNSQDDFARIDGVPVFYGSMEGAGHIATHRHKNGGRFAEVITSWLEWQLKDDEVAGQVFAGSECGLCVDLAWTVQRKGFGQ